MKHEAGLLEVSTHCISLLAAERSAPLPCTGGCPVVHSLSWSAAQCWRSLQRGRGGDPAPPTPPVLQELMGRDHIPALWAIVVTIRGRSHFLHHHFLLGGGSERLTVSWLSAWSCRCDKFAMQIYIRIEAIEYYTCPF